MRVRRSAAAGLVGLALVIGASGCGKITEKVAEEAVERNSDCKDVDIDSSEGGFSGNCGGDDIDLNASGNAELPEGYPAELAPPEGTEIISGTGTGDPVNFNVFGTLQGDVATVYEEAKAQVEGAGYAIEAATDSLADGPTGTVGNFTAANDQYIVNVTVAEVATEDGEVSVNYAVTGA